MRAHAGTVGATAWIDSEHAIDSADGTANRATYDSTDRTSHAVTLVSTTAHATGNALGIRSAR
ncbi:hypothetical protein GCM10007884_15150 [Methylobacterium brachythecii]|uniref:Uncharacterized protein n=1 Tax=Methylobacterium brachythecii TaxID=1176177 RepID=A0ABQ6D1K0_9HYPH|nr:hypothetical protein GCM10007884_15150 [Methylobacterium brachythecii]